MFSLVSASYSMNISYLHVQIVPHIARVVLVLDSEAASTHLTVTASHSSSYWDSLYSQVLKI